MTISEHENGYQVSRAETLTRARMLFLQVNRKMAFIWLSKDMHMSVCVYTWHTTFMNKHILVMLTQSHISESCFLCTG